LKILIVRTDKLGDFITALPAISILKKYNKNNKIIVCVAPLNKALAESCLFIDEVIVDDGQNILKLASKFRDAKVDASITMFSNTRVAFAQFLAKIPKTIAPATKIAQIFYTNRIKQKRSEVKMAEFEYNLQLTRELFSDIDLSYKKPLLEFKEVDNTYKDYICFHVGFGGSSDANWSLDEYSILIREVLNIDKYKVILTFGPDEKHLLNDMKKRFTKDEVVFYLSANGLVEFAKLLSTFKTFISTSTGTYHLASLVETPTITFFADTLFASARRWKSVGDIKQQQHFMIPSDAKEKELLFAEIRLIMKGL